MSQRLANHVALVSGGGGEIGGAIALRYAQEGAAVLVTDVSAEKAAKVAKQINDAGGRAQSLACDVGEASQCEAAVRETVARFGKLTQLVNSVATVTPDGKVEDLPIDAWEKALKINFTGMFLMCKYAMPRIRESGGGSVVNIASSHGHFALYGRVGYCSTKAAIQHFTRVLALDYGTQNIRVNSISPGPIDTERSLWRYKTRENSNRIRGPGQALKRTGTVEEVAHAALFLASDEASFITGADLRVDGGQTIWKREEPAMDAG